MAETIVEPGKGRPPDFRVVQVEMDKEGKKKFVSVGGIWTQGKSKGGTDYSTLKIGSLRLLVFKNEPKPK